MIILKKVYEKPKVEIISYLNEIILDFSTTESTFGWDGEADEEF